MSESQIAIVEPVLAPADVFQSLTNGYGFDNFKTTVEKYINQQSTIVADIGTATGRAAVISAAAAVKACKSPLNKVALEQARVLEGKPKEIRSNLKIIEQMLDDGAESIRKPVTDFEQPRKDKIQEFKNSAVFDGFIPDSVAIQSRLDWLNTVVIDKEFFKDFFSAANKEFNASKEKLTTMLSSAVAAENQARELAEFQAKANRASWVNQISAKGQGLESLQMYQLQTRFDEINALGNGITEDAYAEQYEPAINAQKTALSLVNLAIENLKEVDARVKRQGELKQLLSLPSQAHGMIPEAIAQTIEKLIVINYKADYCKELYGDFVDGKAKVLAELESVKTQKIADAAKAKADAEAKAVEKARLDADANAAAELQRIEKERIAKEATEKAVAEKIECEKQAEIDSKAAREAGQIQRGEIESAVIAIINDDAGLVEDVAKITEQSSVFELMTKEDAISYCYKYEKEYVFESNQRNFDCLIAIIANGTITPSKLPDYGMDYENNTFAEPIEISNEVNEDDCVAIPIKHLKALIYGTEQALEHCGLDEDVIAYEAIEFAKSLI